MRICAMRVKDSELVEVLADVEMQDVSLIVCVQTYCLAVGLSF